METLIKKFIRVIILFSAISCNSIQLYKVTDYNYCHEISLNSNNTYQEYISVNNLRDTFYGNWEIKGDTILLQVIDPVIPNYDDKSRVEEYVYNQQSDIQFKIFCNDSLTYLGIPIYLNDNLNDPIYSDANGIVNIPSETEIEKFQVSYIGYWEVNHKIKLEEANSFKVFLYTREEIPKWTRYNYKYKYLRKGKKLYPYDEYREELISPPLKKVLNSN